MLERSNSHRSVSIEDENYSSSSSLFDFVEGMIAVDWRLSSSGNSTSAAVYFHDDDDDEDVFLLRMAISSGKGVFVRNRVPQEDDEAGVRGVEVAVELDDDSFILFLPSWVCKQPLMMPRRMIIRL
jgi:hypothetical protein